MWSGIDPPVRKLARSFVKELQLKSVAWRQSYVAPKQGAKASNLEDDTETQS